VVQQLLGQMTQRLIAQGRLDPTVAAADASLMHAQGNCCTLLTSMPEGLSQRASELRRERYQLYHSPAAPAGREAFVLRKTTIEPFQGQLKDFFGLETSPSKGCRTSEPFEQSLS
jgi:hypothetical protein